MVTRLSRASWTLPRRIIDNCPLIREENKHRTPILHCFPPTEITVAPIWRRNLVVKCKDDQKSYWKYCVEPWTFMKKTKKPKNITVYNVFWEFSVFPGRNLHLGKEYTYLQSNVDLRLHTIYWKKKIPDKWSGFSVFCNFNKMIHLSPRFHHTTLWLTYFSESLFYLLEEKAQGPYCGI